MDLPISTHSCGLFWPRFHFKADQCAIKANASWHAKTYPLSHAICWLIFLSLQIGFENSGTFDWIPAWLIWALLLIPGPLYVHVTWAPRWRVLCMLADGENPFSDAPLLPNNQSEEFENPMIIQTSDDDILEVVEELSEE